MTKPAFEPGDAPPEELDQLYFNGFAINIGTGDVLITLLRNGKAEQLIQCSYTVAKTLAQGLSTTIAALEEATGNRIMTTHYIDEKLKTEMGSDE